jgi:hypothetical protein
MWPVDSTRGPRLVDPCRGCVRSRSRSGLGGPALDTDRDDERRNHDGQEKS